MIRLLKDSAHFILIALMYLRYGVGITSWRQLRDTFAVWYRVNHARVPENLQAAYGIAVRELDGDTEGEVTPDAIIGNVDAQLTTPRGVNEDRELIDVLIRAMQLPYNRRFSGDRIKAVQRAILTPNENASMQEKVLRAEMTCSSCNYPLRSGELVTFRGDKGVASIQCYRCSNPQYVACHHCHGEVLEIDRKFYIGQTTKCDKHKDIEPKNPTTRRTLEDLLGGGVRRVRPRDIPEPALFAQQVNITWDIQNELNGLTIGNEDQAFPTPPPARDRDLLEPLDVGEMDEDE